MKKFFSIAVAILFTLSLAACGNSSTDGPQPPSNVSTGNTNTSTNNVAVNPSGENEPSATGSAHPTEATATISETVLVDESGVKITAKSLEPNGIFGPEIKLLIENNTDKDLTFQSRNASVNGYMVETMMSVDVASGKKANDTLTFMDTDLQACGIETIADTAFSFHIFTSDTWEDYLDTPQLQLETSAAKAYVYAYDSSGDTVFDGNGVKIVVKGLSEDNSIFGPGIIVYMENAGNNAVTVQARDVSINGFMVDAMFSVDILPGKHAVDAVTFLSSALEENGIEVIESIDLSFHIFDCVTWDTIVDTDIISMTF